MADPEPGRRQQILTAARKVFAERGFGDATIKQIAAEARLRSPALIYWYFKTKEDLFDAVCSEVTPVSREAGDPSQLMELPPEQVLAHLARTYLQISATPDAALHFRIFLAEAARGPPGSSRFSSTELNQFLQFLSAYLQQQVGLGRLRSHDSDTVARVFAGLLLVYVLGREQIHPVGFGLPDEEQYIREVVDLLLEGLRSK